MVDIVRQQADLVIEGGALAIAVLHGFVGGAVLDRGLEVAISLVQARVGRAAVVAQIGALLQGHPTNE